MPSLNILGIGDDEREPLGGAGVLQIQQPDPAVTTPAQALAQLYTNVTDEIRRQRQISAERGLWDEQTGLPTAKGLLDVGRQYGDTMLLGTSAPGVRAYHGSPHSFERFDIGKIGTGEGNQAYGHGLYFAEKEGVARNYRDQGVARHQVSVTDPASGRVYKPGDPYYEDAVKMYGSPGSMYEVNIGANPEHMLHWDKPLSQQSERVRDRIKGRLDWTTDDMTGARIYGELEKRAQRNPVAVTEQLRDWGIPGIRYLDQGSRGAGEGSHNYVVFDDATIDILRKYGIAGLMLGGGAAAAGNAQARENR